jgi:hypothetical protein
MGESVSRSLTCEEKWGRAMDVPVVGTVDFEGWPERDTHKGMNPAIIPSGREKVVFSLE